MTATPTRCTVYIDEAGDLGSGRGSQWFVLTAVVVDKQDEPAIRSQIQQLRASLNIHEIHMKKISNFYNKALISKTLAGSPFTYMNVLFDTDKYDVSKMPTTTAYNYICKYLLQRVSWFLQDTNRIGDIVLSSRGTSRDQELIDYIKDKLFPYQGNSIDPNVFNTVSAKTSASWDLLQLADVCASTLFYSYQKNPYGFITPCHATHFKDKLYRRYGKIQSYGIKYFSNDMIPDITELKKNAICRQNA